MNQRGKNCEILKSNCEFNPQSPNKAQIDFSDVGLVNFRRPIKKSFDENASDSDDPFEDIKACKNIAFSRSRSYFEDDFQRHLTAPVIPRSNLVEKENTVPHSNHSFLAEESRPIHKDFPLKLNDKNRSVTHLRSPLKSYSNLVATPNSKDKAISTPKSKEVSLNPNSNGQKDSADFNIYPSTPLNIRPIASEDSFTSTSNYKGIFDSNLTPFSPNRSFHQCQNAFTPTSKTTPQMSTLKKYSLMKAALSAKKDFENCLKAATLKRSSSKGKLDDNTIIGLHSSSSHLNIKESCKHNSSYKFKCAEPMCSSGTKKKQNCTETSRTVKTFGRKNSHLNAERSFTVDVTTPVHIMTDKPIHTSRCRQSLMNSLNIVSSNSKSEDTNKEKEDCVVIIAGTKQLNTGISEVTHKFSVNQSNKTFTSSKYLEKEEDDDLPCTQPISSVILRGVVAFVEVRSGREYRCTGTKAELESLGAKIEKNFTRKVTHCFFHGGKMSTFRKAIEWKIPIVSTLWIEACKSELQMVPVDGFEPHGIEKYREALPLYKLKTKMTRPVTDSKVLNKPWLRQYETDKDIQAAGTNRQSLGGSSLETDKLIDALHSVADGIKTASQTFQNILTSPILQKTSKQQSSEGASASEKENSEDLFISKKRRNKQLFASSKENDRTTNVKSKQTNDNVDSSTVNDLTDSINGFRVSYDSDDLLVYAKKQAANTRCSAPARLLTSRKCKKLLSSCHKDKTSIEKKNKEPVLGNVLNSAQNSQVVNGSINSRTKSQIQQPRGRKSNLGGNDTNDVKSKQKIKKRKLLLPQQVIEAFEQDSGESATDVSPLYPYAESLNKKQKTTGTSINKTIKTLKVPVILSDWDSDDSLTRAARRESSALFVKKEKKINLQRCTPTIVCTSLHRSDVETVALIVSQLGKFAVEGTVSERTTHVVTASPRRTINLLKGIARGIWILKVQWVYESLEVGKWLPEEKFELIEFSPSVQQARIERQAFGPEFSLELFQGVGPMYVCRVTVPPASDLIQLIRLCGGTVVSSARAANIIIGSSPPFSPFDRQPIMVKEKWVLDCITKLSQLNPYDYIAVDSEP